VTGRDLAVALALVVVAVVAQTTLFAPARIQPFGASPNIVLLTVIATVRYLEPEAGLLTGFTAGLLVDSLGVSPLGLWAMVGTVVAYLTLRFRERAEDGPIAVGVGVFLLTVAGIALYALVATLFGQRTLSDPALIRKIILPGLYNIVLAGAVLPGITLAMGHRRVRGWAT
jgi:rod shape-determining protein MreD